MAIRKPPEPLDATHDRAAFACGVPALNQYLKRRAPDDVADDLTAVFVLRRIDTPQVVGYYTLSGGAIDPMELPPALVRARYPTYPIARIGRLAVDHRYQRQGLGEYLLLDALGRALRISREIGTMAVVVDAKAGTHPFYAQYGFIAYVQHPDSFFLPMETIRQLGLDDV